MRRIVLFAHYDANGEVKPYVLHHLAELRRHAEAVWFFSTAALPGAELDRVVPWCAHAELRENVGMDFSMWRHGLQRLDLGAWDEVLLVNSSVFGPIGSLAPVFERLARLRGDFYGLTESLELTPHYQSYFLGFRRRVLSSPEFERFWASVLPYRHRENVVLSNELGLSAYLRDQGFVGACLAPWEAVLRRAGKHRWRRRLHPGVRFPLELIALGVPYVKVELLRDNPYRVPLAPVLEAMRRGGYDLSLAVLDRPARVRRLLDGLTYWRWLARQPLRPRFG